MDTFERCELRLIQSPAPFRHQTFRSAEFRISNYRNVGFSSYPSFVPSVVCLALWRCQSFRPSRVRAIVILDYELPYYQEFCTRFSREQSSLEQLDVEDWTTEYAMVDNSAA